MVSVYECGSNLALTHLYARSPKSGKERHDAPKERMVSRTQENPFRKQE
ncbi:hypothetical protein KDA_51270 [Dictyobacter alpinus]|uniref:Uncharacterized protein n=1 Tax=Dictyobacter alpinus TaxID=2014873 RepID=A0A402BE27_9CHLR|nr:hypothetical protein KDA_51270 [Dictyobacter alpinus]